MTLIPEDQMNVVATPSNGTSTSNDRAAAMDSSGEAADHQAIIRHALVQAKEIGLTTSEFAQLCGFNALPTWVTGTFSSLHQAGLIARLTEKRGLARKSYVYVSPRFVAGRAVRPYLRNSDHRVKVTPAEVRDAEWLYENAAKRGKGTEDVVTRLALLVTKLMGAAERE